MNKFEYKGQNIEVTGAMKDYFAKKIERSIAHAGELIHGFKVNFEYEAKTNQNTVEIIAFLGNNKTIRNSISSEDMYASIDICSAHVERNIRRYKEKLMHVKRHKSSVEKTKLAA